MAAESVPGDHTGAPGGTDAAVLPEKPAADIPKATRWTYRLIMAEAVADRDGSPRHAGIFALPRTADRDVPVHGRGGGVKQPD